MWMFIDQRREVKKQGVFCETVREQNVAPVHGEWQGISERWSGSKTQRAWQSLAPD